MAPGAKIAVYFAHTDDSSFANAVKAAVDDKTHQPTIISISWGKFEDGWTQQGRAAMDQAFKDAAVLGIPVFAASGDSGSSDGVPGPQAYVDFPASHPLVVGCGGTSLQAAGGQITSEAVWNDASGATGGGVSALTPVPTYQQSINPLSANPPHTPGRGVPDVAGNADPVTGYQVYVDGHDGVTGGTSAVAPLWAAYAALIQQRTGYSVAPLLPTLYRAPTAFHDITEGSNGAYSAGPGWDACTGLGSPVGAALLTAVGSTAAPTSAQIASRKPTGDGARKKSAESVGTSHRLATAKKAVVTTKA